MDGDIAVTFAPVLIAISAVVLAIAIRRTLLRYQQESVDSGPPIIALVLLPTLLGAIVFNSMAVGVTLAGVAAIIGVTKPKEKPSGSWIGRPVVALVFALSIPLILSPTLDRILVAAALLTILLQVIPRHSFAAVVSSTVDGVGLYLVVNVASRLAGIENPTAIARTAGLESTGGGERIFYPLTTSLGIPPLMAAAFIAGFVLCFDGRPMRRAFRLLALVCALVIIIGANTRVALLVAILIGLGSILAPSLLRRFSIPAAGASLALPFAYPVILEPIVRPSVEAFVAVFPVLSRGDRASDVSFAGRDRIWALSLEYWQANVDALHALIGWGFQGQRTSGASAVYGPQFIGLNSDPLSLSAHSTSLQQLFDAGLLGLLALALAVILTVLALIRGARSGDRAHLVALAVSVALVLGGSTETTMSPGYAQEPFWVFVALLLAAARRRDPGQLHATQPADSRAHAGS